MTDLPDRFVKREEIKRCVGLGKSMIHRLMQEGKFPPAVQAVAVRLALERREIIAWIDDVKDGVEGKKRKDWAGVAGSAPQRH